MRSSSLWVRTRRRLRYWVARADRTRLLREEMTFHVDSLTDDLVRRGLSPEEARQTALQKFGNVTLKTEDADSIWIARWLRDLAGDLRHGSRMMRRDVAVTTFVILIAGLGIGASATVFSVVNTLLFRPLPFRDPHQLVWISNVGQNGEEWTLQVGHVVDVRDRNTSFTDLAGWDAFYRPGDSELTGVGEPERVTSVPVTVNFFSLLGVRPALGRLFTPAEGTRPVRTPPATILSSGFWRRRFASDPSIIGRPLTLNNQPVTVVGVLPESFDFASVFEPGTTVDLFLPWPLTDETNSQGNTTIVIGRLKSNVALGQAQAELTSLGRQLEREHPNRNGVRPRLDLVEHHVSGPVSLALIVLAMAVAVVMLIVCANLSNLQLARMASRQKELAVRVALGAGRLRLLRQLLTESVALSALGALFGLGLAALGTRELAHLTAFRLPLLSSVRTDGAALLFTALAAVFSGVLFGILPALQVRTFAVEEAIREGSRGSTRGRRQTWIRNLLVVSEVALACTLLVGTGLLVRSFLQTLDVQLGYRPDQAAAVRVDPSFRFASFANQNAYIDTLLDRARAVDGVDAAGLTDVLPLGGDRSWGVVGRGQVYPRGQSPEAFIRVVTDGYFDAVGIPVMNGRGFTTDDRATGAKVAVVNETLARTLWSGQDAIGQVLALDGGRTVVGVVGDVRHATVEQPGGSELYLPMRQTADYARMQLVVRTSRPLTSLAPDLGTALRPLDPKLPLQAMLPLQDLVDRALSPRRFLVWLLAGFAGFALLLASLGIYAVISHAVAQRTQEIGIRLALGASSGTVVAAILGRTLGLAGTGLVIGLVASRLVTAALRTLLFGVTPGDPTTFALMAFLLGTVAALAGYIPARRATRIDPTETLRAN